MKRAKQPERLVARPKSVLREDNVLGATVGVQNQQGCNAISLNLSVLHTHPLHH